MLLMCRKCGGEAYVKLIDDETYSWCDECGCVEDSVDEIEESAAERLLAAIDEQV